jgi:hypothetical protein
MNGATQASGGRPSQETSRRAARERGLADKLRPPCRQCYVVTSEGIRSSHQNVCDGMDGLRFSSMYSVLISDDGIILARRIPSMGASSAKMARVEAVALRSIGKVM